ncbi:ribosome maturation factor RimM [Helicobacter sp.]|uniref:ribosome maturation factor RimM n=1 Tax=Helicobacter sp. TaxID=218 RepID=UPI0025B8377E|nr:ribosome maturation factor RimM [Helicobacter sp.]MCI5967903.1 ribosome maturation factor RimM [Helicobacter sp.]MDY2584802.1 ribosome maturation factor RimM [Helicobacter sp.]
MMRKIPKDWVGVAKIGRSLGFKGDVLLHLLSDFPESFKTGNVYHSQFGDLTLESYSPQKSTAKFQQINSKEEAKQIVNCILYSTQEETKAQCKLEDNAFFWFELIESVIVENDEVLGMVSEIDRFCNQDYLFIKTDSILITQGFPKSFLIPYNKRYILNVESKVDSIKTIRTQFCKEILENS